VAAALTVAALGCAARQTGEVATGIPRAAPEAASPRPTASRTPGTVDVGGLFLEPGTLPRTRRNDGNTTGRVAEVVFSVSGVT
jgi:hypothetical protein